MGMYTTLFLNTILSKDTPQDVIKGLQWGLDDSNFYYKMAESVRPDEPFFTNHSYFQTVFLDTDTRYRRHTLDTSYISQRNDGSYLLNVVSCIKQYELQDDLTKLAIKYRSIKENNNDYHLIGTSRYEEYEWPHIHIIKDNDDSIQIFPMEDYLNEKSIEWYERMSEKYGERMPTLALASIVLNKINKERRK